MPEAAATIVGNAAIASPIPQPVANPLVFPVPRGATPFRLFVLGIAAAYLIFGRTFAYVGVTGLYPGEVLLLVASFGRYGWIRVYLTNVRLRPALACSILLFLLWGCVEAARGYVSGYPLLDIAKGLPTHYYPLLLFAGLSAGRFLTVARLKSYHFWLTVATGVWGAATTIVLNRGDTTALPWAPDVYLFSGPSMPPLCLLIYLSLSARLTWTFIMGCATSVIALLIGGRAALLGVIGGFGILALRPKRLRFVAHLSVICLIAIAVWVTFSGVLPDLGGRTGRATPTLIWARLVTIVDPGEAALMVQGTDADVSALITDAGDADWRRDLWRATIDSLSTTRDWIIGHGLGPVLGDLLTGAAGEGYGHDLRTPHNFAIYLLGYTGLVGCLLYLMVVLAVLVEIARCPSSLVKDATLAAGASIMIMALAGNLLETPFGAVPAYTSIGVLLAVAQRQPFRSYGLSNSASLKLAGSR